MYEKYFGLREQPFGVTPDPRFLYLSAAHREALASLYYGIEANRGFLGLIDEQSGVARLQMGANLNKLGELLETFADWSDDRRVSTALRYLGVLRDSHEGGEQ